MRVMWILFFILFIPASGSGKDFETFYVELLAQIKESESSDVRFLEFSPTELPEEHFLRMKLVTYDPISKRETSGVQLFIEVAEPNQALEGRILGMVEEKIVLSGMLKDGSEGRVLWWLPEAGIFEFIVREGFLEEESFFPEENEDHPPTMEAYRIIFNAQTFLAPPFNLNKQKLSTPSLLCQIPDWPDCPSI